MTFLSDPIDMAHLPYENWRALNDGATNPDCEGVLGMTPREHFHAYLWPRVR